MQNLERCCIHVHHNTTSNQCVYIAYYFFINLPYPPPPFLLLISHACSSPNHLNPSLSAPSLHLLTIPQQVLCSPNISSFLPTGSPVSQTVSLDCGESLLADVGAPGLWGWGSSGTALVGASVSRLG